MTGRGMADLLAEIEDRADRAEVALAELRAAVVEFVAAAHHAEDDAAAVRRAIDAEEALEHVLGSHTNAVGPLPKKDMRSDLTTRMQAAVERDPEHVLRVFLDLSASAARSAQIESMSDAGLAVVCDTLSDGLPINDALADLLDQISHRLRRANGASFRSCSWCNKEAQHRVDDQWGCDEHANGEVPR